MKKSKKYLLLSVFMLISFIIWTIMVKLIDVKAIGPENSFVGFAAINKFIHSYIGVNMNLYIITDWLGLVPMFFALCFAVLGFLQLIKRKSLFRVDYNILFLGLFYIIIMLIYILFEVVIINFRPILINGYLEASYPSSTTLLTICVMMSTAIQFNIRIKNIILRSISCSLVIVFTMFMVVGRFVSGVHWFSDIVGGVFLSVGLVSMYYSIIIGKSN